MKKTLLLSSVIAVFILATGCTQETQNKLGRAIQNWTGTNGVLEVYAGDKLVRRFLKIDKLSTATSTEGDTDRPYRFGYGVMDENLNGKADSGVELLPYLRGEKLVKGPFLLLQAL